MAALDCVFGYGRRRGLVELLPRLLALGAAMGVCVVSAIAIVRFGPLLTGDFDGILAVLSFLVRWLLAAAVLGLGLTSIAFGLYATYVASYTSVFGHLASIFVLLLYRWLSGDAFLAGIQLDACVRERS
jgi:hypothetical protein